MRTKFAYNGKVIRTSYNKYTHAVVIEKPDGRIVCLSCSSRRELAEKALASRLKARSEDLAWLDNVAGEISAITISSERAGELAAKLRAGADLPKIVELEVVA